MSIILYFQDKLKLSRAGLFQYATHPIDRFILSFPKAVALLMVFSLSMTSFSQQGTPIRVEGIPQPLRWENRPLSHAVGTNGFTIVAGPKTDMFRDPNVTYNTDNAPKLLFTPDPDFVLSVGIQHAFASKWDGGAIVLKQDSANWVKFCFEKDYTGARRVVSVVTRDISDDCNSVEIPSDKVYFKMARAGKVITLYYSLDQTNWMLVRHFQFNATKPLMLGFLAQSPTGKECSVVFSDIRYQARTIKDPYLGE